MFIAISKAVSRWGWGGGDKCPRLKRDSCYQDNDYLAHSQWLQKKLIHVLQLSTFLMLVHLDPGYSL